MTDILIRLSREYGVPAIDLMFYEIHPDVIALVPKHIAERFLLIPISRVGPVITICMADPLNLLAIDDVRFLTGYHVECLVVSEESIREALVKFYPEEGPEIEVVSISDDGLKMNLATPTKPLEEIAAPLLQDCVERARHIPTRKQPASYFCQDDDSNLSFEQKAKRLIEQAIRGR